MNGLFETVLVRDAAPVLLGPHLDRLLRSAAELRVPGAPERGRLEERCLRAASTSGLASGRMRIALEKGEISVGVEPFEGYPPELYERGAVALLAASRGHPLASLAGHKVLPYDPLLSARRRAWESGAFEVILRDADGALLEGSSSNLFLLSRGELLTPPPTRPILSGVTRAAVIGAAAGEGLAVRESDLFPRDLETAEAAFLTGALMEVVPLAAVGEVSLPPGRDLARRLRLGTRESL